MTHVVSEPQCCSACLIPFCNTESIACQCYQSSVSRPTREPDGLNKSNMMQEHASCLSKMLHASCSGGIKMPLRARLAALPVWSSFQRTKPCDHYLSLKKTTTKKLHKHHLTKPSSLWMVIPDGTASRGNANK